AARSAIRRRNRGLTVTRASSRCAAYAAESFADQNSAAARSLENLGIAFPDLFRVIACLVSCDTTAFRRRSSVELLWAARCPAPSGRTARLSNARQRTIRTREIDHPQPPAPADCSSGPTRR